MEGSPWSTAKDSSDQLRCGDASVEEDSSRSSSIAVLRPVCARARTQWEDPWIAAGDAQEIAADRPLQLQCSNQCLREMYAVGDSPWITGRAAKRCALAKCDQLQRCGWRMWTGGMLGGGRWIAVENAKQIASA